MARWRGGKTALTFPPPRGVGIVNVTDDSFYEGARSGTPERAVADAGRLLELGFEIVDVGAVPAAEGPPVPAEEETARLVPVVRSLARSGAPVTIDTFLWPVVRAVAEELDWPSYEGFLGVNDTSGAADPEMLEVVGDLGCAYVLMHAEGPPRRMRHPRSHEDPVEHLRAWFSRRIEAALDRGVAEEQIALDPGLDFDLSVEDGLEVLRRLGELRSLGRPLFVALSRKDFLGAVLAGSWERRAPARDREWATAAATALAIAAGADMVRLHDPSALDALRVAAAICGRRDGTPERGSDLEPSAESASYADG